MQKITCGGDWLIDYADGALSSAERDQAEAHLAACDRCRRELRALRTSGEVLTRHFESLRSNATTPPAWRRNWSLVARGVAAVAAGLAVAVIGYAVSHRRPAEHPPRNRSRGNAI